MTKSPDGPDSAVDGIVDGIVDGTAAAEHELAAVLRTVLQRLHDESVPPAQLHEATELARRLYDTLAGDPRPPWYAQGFSNDRDERRARMHKRAHALYRGRSSALAPPITLTTIRLDDGRDAIEGRVTLARRFEGPPNGVHGGYVAGLFDDVLGASQSLIDGPTGLTGTLHVRYRSLTPLDTELVFRAWVDHVRGRRILARATCHAGSELTAEAQGLFVRVDMEALVRSELSERRS